MRLLLAFLVVFGVFISGCSNPSDPDQKSTPLEAPALLYPKHDTTGVVDPPTLRWEAVTGATQYHVEISRQSDFTRIIDSAFVTTNSFTVRRIDATAPYYWRVRAMKGDKSGNWSEGRRFSTIVIIQPITAGTILKYSVVDLQTSKRDTMIIEIKEVGITFDGQVNVTKISSTYLGSTTERYMQYLPNGNIAFYDDNWREVPVGNRQDYQTLLDTVDETSQHYILEQVTAQFVGVAQYNLDGTIYPTSNAAIWRGIYYFNKSLQTYDNTESTSAQYNYSPDLRFMTSFQTTFATNSTAVSLQASLIEIRH